MNHEKFLEFLRGKRACQGAIEEVTAKKWTSSEAWENCAQGDWMMWLYKYSINPDQISAVKIAVMSAECVIDIFENRNPGDTRPRKAIAAARAWIENPTEKNRQNAADAAYAAAYAAHAADAAAYAAHAIAAAYAAHAIVADIIESALIWWTHPPVEE